MSITIEEAIDEVNLADDPNTRNQPLPDKSLIKKYEEKTGLMFSAEYKKFLEFISNAFVGYLSPFTLNEQLENKYGDLLWGISEGQKLGLPDDWVPICEDNGDYYCISPDGVIRFWDHNGSTDESWPDLATWVKDVWLEGG